MATLGHDATEHAVADMRAQSVKIWGDYHKALIEYADSPERSLGKPPPPEPDFPKPEEFDALAE